MLVGRKQSVEKLAQTDEQGRFRVTAPRGKLSIVLVARAADAGIDFIDLGSLKGDGQVELRLVKDHPIHHRLFFGTDPSAAMQRRVGPADVAAVLLASPEAQLA